MLIQKQSMESVFMFSGRSEACLHESKLCGQRKEEKKKRETHGGGRRSSHHASRMIASICVEGGGGAEGWFFVSLLVASLVLSLMTHAAQIAKVSLRCVSSRRPAGLIRPCRRLTRL